MHYVRHSGALLAADILYYALLAADMLAAAGQMHHLRYCCAGAASCACHAKYPGSTNGGDHCESSSACLCVLIRSALCVHWSPSGSCGQLRSKQYCGRLLSKQYGGRLVGRVGRVQHASCFRGRVCWRRGSAAAWTWRRACAWYNSCTKDVCAAAAVAALLQLCCMHCCSSVACTVAALLHALLQLCCMLCCSSVACSVACSVATLLHVLLQALKR